MLVHPLAPLKVVDREHCSGELYGRQRSDELFRGVPNGFGRDAGRADLKQARHDLTVRRDSLEWCCEAFPLVFFRPLAELFRGADGILVLSIGPGEQREGRYEGGKKIATGSAKQVGMAFNWVVHLLTHCLPRVEGSGANVT